MNTFYYILMWYCSIVVVFFVYAFLTAKPYPKEWEEEDNKEIERKFKEHKKSQD